MERLLKTIFQVLENHPDVLRLPRRGDGCATGPPTVRWDAVDSAAVLSGWLWRRVRLQTGWCSPPHRSTPAQGCCRFASRSFVLLLKRDSAAAVSQQLPFRLMLGSQWFRRADRRHRSCSNCCCPLDPENVALLWSQAPGCPALFPCSLFSLAPVGAWLMPTVPETEREGVLQKW